MHAGASLRPLLGAMLQDTADLLRQAAVSGVDPARLDRAQLRLADQAAEYLQHHANAQLEARHPMDRCEMEVRLLEQVEQLCDDCVVILASHVADAGPVRDGVVALRSTADRLAWLADVVGEREPRPEPLPADGSDAGPAWAQRLERVGEGVRTVRETSRRLADLSEPVPALLGMA